MTVFQLQQNYFFIFVLKLDFYFAVRSLASSLAQGGVKGQESGLWCLNEVTHDLVTHGRCVCVCARRCVSAVLRPVPDGSHRAICPHHVPHLGGFWDLYTHPGPKRNRNPNRCHPGINCYPGNRHSIFLFCESYKTNWNLINSNSDI